MKGIDHASRAVSRSERSGRRPTCAVPEREVAARLVRESSGQIPVEVDADCPCKPEGFVVLEDRCPECVPREHEEGGRRIEVGVRLQVSQPLKPPALDLATGNVERIFRRDGIRIPWLVEQRRRAPLT